MKIPDTKNPGETKETLRKAYAQTELLLSSIPSILIGVGENGRVRHWNATAENVFGISCGEVKNRAFSECGIQWDPARVIAGIDKCRTTGQITRLDDVSFRRPNGREGFLGLTIIPLSRDKEGNIEYVLFGADITERRRMDQLKSEFVSTVSHELRTPLAIIREGVSQVLEGLAGETSREQEQFLTIALSGIDRLTRLIDDLLNISRIEAGKSRLQRELVDIAAVAKEVAISFAERVQNKGLEIKGDYPQGPVEIYADRDKIFQVFTNLVMNAVKFTEKGSIGISVKQQGDTVECSVTDTGRGVAPEDLPKLFNKFEQFSRETAAGEKGTGLGLAISKGFVELHGGKIWVESRMEQGAKFIFALPKFTARELFRGYVTSALENAVRHRSPLSLAVFDTKNFDEIRERLGRERAAAIMHEVETWIRRNLRGKADITVKDTRAILVLLPATGKEDALMVAGRIHQMIGDQLARHGLEPRVEVTCKVASFPEDGRTEEALLNKVFP